MHRDRLRLAFPEAEVDATDISAGTLPPEHRHEPSLGLDGGDDGLAIVSRILEGAARHLTEHGTLIVEAGEAAPAAEARYPRLPFVWLELRRGGEGVFLLEAQELRRCFSGGTGQ